MCTRRLFLCLFRWVAVAIGMIVLPTTVFSDGERLPVLVPVESSVSGTPAGLSPACLAPGGVEQVLTAVLLPSHPLGDKGSLGTLVEGGSATPAPGEQAKLDAARQACTAAATVLCSADRLAMETDKQGKLEASNPAPAAIDPASGLGVELPEVQQSGPPGLNESEQAKLRESGLHPEVQP